MSSTPLLDYAAARTAGEIAASACAEKAERHGFDTEGARAFILRILETAGPQSGEQLVLLAKAAGFVGHDDRCFGAVFGVLARRGQIEVVGSCARKRGHGTSGGRIWGLAKRRAA